MDFLSIVQQYIDPSMLIVVAVLWFLGWAFKQVKQVPNWSIVFIMIILGIAFGLALIGTNANGIIQGILAAALAVLGHQAVKQTANAAEEIKKE